MKALCLGLCLVLELVCGLMFGTARLTSSQVMHALWLGPGGHDVGGRIIWSVRLPRCLLALVAGGCFAQGGALLQIVTRNVLADPYLFGLSSGAAAGAVAVIVFLGNFAGIWTPFLGAGFGAVLATCVFGLLLLASQGGERKSHLVLGGLAISFLFSALTNIFIVFGDRNTAQSVLFWTMGSFASAQWQFIPFALVGLFILLLFRSIYNQSLYALLAGDDTARSLGVDAQRLRKRAIFCCAIGCGLNVCVCGPVPFIGLVVPHLARFMNPRVDSVGYYSAALGALLTLGADIVSRSIMPAQELPVGVLISVIGSVFLLIFLKKYKSAF
ncbi:FecCD family ABC transporter permease [Neokomagataea anthophila]|uniref:Iron ABC transporter permease n=1 Tax=Neokomagataea anthophila TaxID=2826925 RepID=A0ABS5E9H6_9PROT|nr:iron ABC transporter permease [Neokomagataea anthophila]MBR0560563.1 iron ABC transporter permease [Neokomagataea anthophila]